MNKLRHAYGQQKVGANARGIDFSMTFEEWLGVWESSGHLDERGRMKGQYCMSRYGDAGPYAIGNVFIQLHSINIVQGNTGIKHLPRSEQWRERQREAQLGKTFTQEAKDNMSEAGKGRKQSEEHKKKKGDARKVAWARYREQKQYGKYKQYQHISVLGNKIFI